MRAPSKKGSSKSSKKSSKKSSSKSFSTSSKKTYSVFSKRTSSSRTPSTSRRRKLLRRAKKTSSRRSRFPRWIIVSLFVLALLILIFYVASIQLKFVLQEEMIVSLSPTEASLTVDYDEQPEITFTATVDNLNLCRFTCEHDLIDLSDNSVLYNESFVDEQTQVLTHVLPVNARGAGQKLFNYKVRCHNIKSRLCSTNEKTYFKTALISVNYELPDVEQTVKQELFGEVSQALNRLEVSGLLLDQSSLLLSSLERAGPLTPAEIKTKEQLSLLQSRLDAYNDSRTRWINLWEQQFYFELADAFSDQDADVIKNLHENASNLRQDLVSYALALNDGFDYLQTMSAAKQQLSDAYVFYIAINDTSSLVRLDTLVKESRLFSRSLLAKNFSSFSRLASDAEFLSTDLDTVIVSYAADSDSVILGSKDDLELLESLHLYLSRLGNSLPSISYPVSSLSDACMVANDLLPLIASFNQSQLAYQQSQYPYLVNTSLFQQAIDTYHAYALATTLGTSASFDLDPDLYGAVPIVLNNSTNTTFNLSVVPREEFAQMTPIKTSTVLTTFSDEYCSSSTNASVNLSFLNDSFSEYVLDVVLPDLNDTTLMNLSQNRPLCCIYSSCSPCCGSSCSNDNYPVVFVHGHAISKENRPEMSHEAFAMWQELLEEEGYINAGQIGAEQIKDVPPGEWGKADAPIAVRVSYYLLSYYDLGSYQLIAQKSDKIENYAIRLHELVTLIKQRTGKDKVIIVAHSMGGLVVREYLSVFGEGSVDRFIMLGTPNYGIEGRVRRLCSVTGASRECAEMSADSIFLKRLNAPANTLSIPTYTLRATGCTMHGEDGDGIVLARNVPLPYAKNYVLEGECTDKLESNLHTRMLNPTLYPQTFELVRDLIQGVKPASFEE